MLLSDNTPRPLCNMTLTTHTTSYVSYAVSMLTRLSSGHQLVHFVRDEIFYCGFMSLILLMYQI